MQNTLEYWEGPDIHDLTYDEMVAEIDNYIEFVRHVGFMYRYMGYTGVVRIGFHHKPTMDRCELVAWNPELDSIYTTTAVVDAMVAKYPDLFEEPGRNMMRCEKCGSENATITERPDEPDGSWNICTTLTCNDCGHVEAHGFRVLTYNRKHTVHMEW